MRQNGERRGPPAGPHRWGVPPAVPEGQELDARLTANLTRPEKVEFVGYARHLGFLQDAPLVRVIVLEWMAKQRAKAERAARRRRKKAPPAP